MTETPSVLTETPDLAAATTDRDPFDVVPQVLDLVRLSGAIFFRSDWRAPWAYFSPPTTELAGRAARRHGQPGDVPHHR